MVLIIDNYDSFVENLARYCRELGKNTVIYRNNKITIADIYKLQPSHIIISPGPCKPQDAGISIAVVKEFYSSIPILGVCLGHQAIGEAFGAVIDKAIEPMHGMSSNFYHNKSDILQDIPSPTDIGRYHSLVIDPKTMPKDLVVTGRSKLGEIMSIKHKIYPTFGVQFHPESILTTKGYNIIKSFLNLNQ